MVAGRASTRTVRAARQLGENLATWRKLQDLTAEQVAERAGISRTTLSKLEHGDLGVGTGVLLEVLRALGQLDAMVTATDPLQSDVGRLRAKEHIPKRVRGPRGTPTSGARGDESADKPGSVAGRADPTDGRPSI